MQDQICAVTLSDLPQAVGIQLSMANLQHGTVFRLPPYITIHTEAMSMQTQTIAQLLR